MDNKITNIEHNQYISDELREILIMDNIVLTKYYICVKVNSIIKSKEIDNIMNSLNNLGVKINRICDKKILQNLLNR